MELNTLTEPVEGNASLRNLPPKSLPSTSSVTEKLFAEKL
jgi:hypothetical protein